MPVVFKDRVLETSTTSGTGSMALAGAVVGFRAFSASFASLDEIPYLVEAVDANGLPSGQWEVGYGTYVSASNTLARTLVVASSASGAKVTFSAGPKRVSCTLFADAITKPGFVARLPIVDGSTSFAPGGTEAEGTKAWSTTLKVPMIWNGLKWKVESVPASLRKISAGETVVIPQDNILLTFGGLTVEGTLILDGTLIPVT